MLIGISALLVPYQFWSGRQLLQRKQAVLSPFFSPAVLRTLTAADPEAVLKPREIEVTVLFCDLRGFSRKSEKESEKLLPLLERVSKALGVMTQNILDQGGKQEESEEAGVLHRDTPSFRNC